PALVVSLEMAALELFRRIVARTTGTYLGRLKTGEIPPAKSAELARRAVAAAPDLALVDATQLFPTADWLQQAAEATRGDRDHLLIVVDSAHSWADAMPGAAHEYDRLNAAIAALRTLALTLGWPILATCERNRANMESGGTNASAGTRKFEYAAET